MAFCSSDGGGEESGLVALLEWREDDEVRVSTSEDGLDAIADFRAINKMVQTG